ncbi:cobyric acid synthase [Thermosulfurimonas marina]|uniref:Cobyric acid synthase n=1 Tax=Thermosulfurimonas marina TaxID=2047767 RepID=A0A6H1WTQ0_9BACT|nr:cobyric acid synthase [Thermosulfurimonas marina]QJA06583.1 cobyric acid synthase [Thermosulfurimonas marina]
MGRALAFMGSMSSVGKTFLAALACRWFAKKGLRVFPFKAQNMSLNALATEEGEMAWAQAYQALVAGRKPSVRMNPLLLKPLAEHQAEIIFLGNPEGVLPAGRFREFRRAYRQRVFAVLEEVLAENDLVIVEGAGGLAELNLLEGDLANYELLRTFRLPFVLIGDIDRGGVFAQLLGTLELLPEIRDLCVGLVVNKFRGAVELFEEGGRILSARSGKPLLGLLPYQEVHFLEEDSASLVRFSGFVTERPLKVAVLAYPYLSNFLDLDPLRHEEDVELIFTQDPRALEEAEAVILPGSRNVARSMAWLRERGLAETLKKLAGKKVLFGLCGGFQLLGRTLRDPEGLEFGGEVEGLGLLPHETLFRRPKRRGPLQDRPDFPFWKGPLSGFEIRYGRSFWAGEEILSLAQGEVLGTYLHGVFFDDAFRTAFLNFLRERRGLAPQPPQAYQEKVAGALDRVLEHPAFSAFFEALGDLDKF